MKQQAKQPRSSTVAQAWQVVHGCLIGLTMLYLLLLPASGHAQRMAKSIEGRVLGSSDSTLPGAIVYLQDEKTNVIRTLIATAAGGYRFAQLPADTDYQIWAEFKGKKSKVRLVSSFDTKQNLTYDFHVSDK